MLPIRPEDRADSPIRRPMSPEAHSSSKLSCRVPLARIRFSPEVASLKSVGSSADMGKTRLARTHGKVAHEKRFTFFYRNRLLHRFASDPTLFLRRQRAQTVRRTMAPTATGMPRHHIPGCAYRLVIVLLAPAAHSGCG